MHHLFNDPDVSCTLVSSIEEWPSSSGCLIKRFWTTKGSIKPIGAYTVNFFERLLQAKTETEFFVLVSSLLNPNSVATIRGKMTSVHEGGELVLCLTLEQTLAYLQ